MIAPQPPPGLLMSPAERRRWLLSTWRYAVPALISAALVLAMLAPLPLPVPAMPQLGLMGVLAWAVLQPALMPPWVAFFVGGLADVLFGTPLGLNATLFAVATGAMRLIDQGVGERSHGFDWAVAAVLLAAVLLLTGPLMAVAGRPVPMAPLLWQLPSSLLMWPLVVRFSADIQRRLVASANDLA